MRANMGRSKLVDLYISSSRSDTSIFMFDEKCLESSKPCDSLKAVLPL